MELRPPSSLGAATSPHTNVLVVTVWDTVTNSRQLQLGSGRSPLWVLFKYHFGAGEKTQRVGVLAPHTDDPSAVSWSYTVEGRR